MKEQFINEFITKLDGIVPESYFNDIRNILTLHLKEFDVKRMETNLAINEVNHPYYYEAFFVSKKIEGMSQTSLELYKAYLDIFFRYVNKPVDKITPNEIRLFLYQVQKDRGISNRTLDTVRSIVNSFLEWSAVEGYIASNPCRTVKPIKCEEKERKPLTNLELELVRTACRDAREQALVEVLYSTGCRVTELERLNKSDVDFETKEVALFGKGNKHRTSYLNARAEVALKRYLAERTDDNEALFVYAIEPHDRLKKAGIEKIIRDLGEVSNIGRKLHPHLFRHTMATDGLSRGMSAVEIQRVLGHSNLDTTMIYAKVNDADVKTNHSKCIV